MVISKVSERMCIVVIVVVVAAVVVVVTVFPLHAFIYFDSW